MFHHLHFLPNFVAPCRGLFVCSVQLAPAYVYLASDDASYTSGTTLGVAGGMYLN